MQIVKIIQEERNEHYISIFTNYIGLMVKNLPKKKTPSIGDFTGEYHKTFQEGIIPILHNILEMEEERHFPTHFIRPALFCSKPDKGIRRRENYKTNILMNIDAEILNKCLAN